MSITLKIKFNEDVRRITLDKPTKFAELRTVLSGLFRSLPENYVLKYVDEEEDLITISSDMELEEAFELAKKSPIKILRLNIHAESASAPFVVNQNDVSKLACNAMSDVVNAQGFQTLISSPGFQQLVPQILNSDAFKQQLIPQMLNANNMQQLLPALTNVTPDLNNLFSALMPVIMNAVTANLQHAKQQAPPQAQQSTQTETTPEKPVEVAVPRETVTFPETSESKELLAKEIAAQFEVVEIEKEPTPVVQSSPVQEKKQEAKEEISTTSSTSEPAQLAAPEPTPTPAAEPTPAPAPKVPEIPEQLVPAVRALVDMGFTDIARNLDLLEKHNGNLLRVIELCLGEVQD